MSLVKSCNLDQTVLFELMNKSHKGFMLNGYPENASVDQKG